MNPIIGWQGFLPSQPNHQLKLLLKNNFIEAIATPSHYNSHTESLFYMEIGRRLGDGEQDSSVASRQRGPVDLACGSRFTDDAQAMEFGECRWVGYEKLR